LQQLAAAIVGVVAARGGRAVQIGLGGDQPARVAVPVHGAGGVGRGDLMAAALVGHRVVVVGDRLAGGEVGSCQPAFVIIGEGIEGLSVELESADATEGIKLVLFE
jgi:hypothetical protein